MFKASRAKKALAVLLAVLLLASCLAVAGVSAATVVRMQTDYETAMSQYGETSAATNNVYKDAVKVRRCAQAGIGHNGSDGAMEIAFSGDTALPGAFRIFGSGVSAHRERNGRHHLPGHLLVQGGSPDRRRRADGGIRFGQLV